MKRPWTIGHGKESSRNMRNRVKEIILRRVLTLPDQRLWIKMIIEKKKEMLMRIQFSGEGSSALSQELNH